jgi:hypothetical protein
LFDFILFVFFCFDFEIKWICCFLFSSLLIFSFFHEKNVPFDSKGNQIAIHTEDGYVILEAKSFKKKKKKYGEEDESINASTGAY